MKEKEEVGLFLRDLDPAPAIRHLPLGLGLAITSMRLGGLKSNSVFLEWNELDFQSCRNWERSLLQL
jgi:hypothetical protein